MPRSRHADDDEIDYHTCRAIDDYFRCASRHDAKIYADDGHITTAFSSLQVAGQVISLA